MSDKKVKENNQKKPRITWKQAFHLLKCVALRKFKIKWIVDDGAQATIKPNLPLDNSGFNSQGEKIIYSTVRRPPPLTKNYVSIIDLNLSSELKKISLSDHSDELKSESLARSIILGIVDEIRSRGSSAGSRRDSVSREISSFNLNPNIIPESSSASRNEKHMENLLTNLKGKSDVIKTVVFPKDNSKSKASQKNLQLSDIDNFKIRSTRDSSSNDMKSPVRSSRQPDNVIKPILKVVPPPSTQVIDGSDKKENKSPQREKDSLSDKITSTASDNLPPTPKQSSAAKSPTVPKSPSTARSASIKKTPVGDKSASSEKGSVGKASSIKDIPVDDKSTKDNDFGNEDENIDEKLIVDPNDYVEPQTNKSDHVSDHVSDRDIAGEDTKQPSVQSPDGSKTHIDSESGRQSVDTEQTKIKIVLPTSEGTDLMEDSNETLEANQKDKFSVVEDPNKATSSTSELVTVGNNDDDESYLEIADSNKADQDQQNNEGEHSDSKLQRTTPEGDKDKPEDENKADEIKKDEGGQKLDSSVKSSPRELNVQEIDAIKSEKGSVKDDLIKSKSSIAKSDHGEDNKESEEDRLKKTAKENENDDIDIIEVDSSEFDIDEKPDIETDEDASRNKLEINQVDSNEFQQSEILPEPEVQKTPNKSSSGRSKSPLLFSIGNDAESDEEEDTDKDKDKLKEKSKSSIGDDDKASKGTAEELDKALKGKKINFVDLDESPKYKPATSRSSNLSKKTDKIASDSFSSFSNKTTSDEPIEPKQYYTRQLSDIDYDKADQSGPSTIESMSEILSQKQSIDSNHTVGTKKPAEDSDTDDLDIEGTRKRKSTKEKMNPNHFYELENLVFKPMVSEESNIPDKLIQLFHSFGYDCKKRSNLQLIDSDTLIFSAGSLVQLLNIKTREQQYLRTLSGGAVGAIAVHPSRKYFAVGEKGNVPNINIFEYPSLKLFRILRQGTLKGYAYLDYDPKGRLLASLGSAPDYMLTIWDWKQENVVLRTKAFSQDIYKCTFSKDLKGILTSAGTGHIKFWKMASTFTGFKLQGDLGKFGKTEISDIEGYAELPDGKVLSGSEWGNMLLWDGGLIQTEICRKKNKSCHTGSIQQITLNEGDIYTIGDDGSIRVWDFETIDTAEPSDEGIKLEIEPLNELKVGNNVALRSMVKDFTEESTIWYAQDSNGGIWKLDLGFSASSENPRQLFNFHSGIIHGIECCPISHLFATTADDGSVKVYDYLTTEILVQRKFNKGGTSLKWLSTNIDPEGGTICVGFQDGVLRFLKLVPKANNDQQFDLVLFEAFKPHTQAVTRIAVDSKNTLIATGSDDNTIFFFSNSKNTRTPIGFVTLPSPVTYMTWTPAEYANNRLLVCMKDGSVYEFDAPVPGKYDTTKTYLIEMKLNVRKYNFKSIKSRLRHEEELERKRIEEEERKKKEAEERRLRGIDDEEEEKKKKAKKNEESGGENAESDNKNNEKKDDEENPEEVKKEDEWKPYIPEVPNKILWANYSSPDTFWVSVDDYDAGYLYECRFLDDAQKAKLSPDKIDEPFRAIPVANSDLTHGEDIPLTCMIFDKNKKYAVFGQKNGVLRAQPMPSSKLFEEIKHHWSLGFHDNDYGHVTNICYSYDEKYLFSVGADSNIFGLLFNSTEEDLNKAKQEKIKVTCKVPSAEVSDIDDPQAYSIEQAKQKSENDKMIAVAESKKQDMRQKINQLRKNFKDLLVKNDQLVPRLKLGKNEFLLEESIKEQVLEQINDKINLTWKELAWQSEKCRLLLDKLQSKFKDVIDCEHIIVYTFDSSLSVSTFRTVSLPKDMEKFKNDLENQYLASMMEKLKNKDKIEAQAALDQKGSNDLILDGPSTADQLKKIFGKLRGNTAARVERALKKMDEKKLKRLKRKKEWENLLNSRLPDDYENPDDLANIKNAEENLGDFKLKTSDNFIIPEDQRMNVYKAVERLMQIKQFINKNQMLFNKKVIGLRDKKKDIVNEINKNIDRLEQIQYLLGQSSERILVRPSLRPEEVPEQKYEYTRDKLMEFKKEVESKSFNVQKHEDEGAGGFGGFGASSSNNGGNAQPNSAKLRQIANDKADAASKAAIIQLQTDGVRPLWQNKDSMSNLMKETVKVKEMKLMFEQKQLYKMIEEKILLFDAELKVLRHEKARIAVYMKNADLRHLTIFEEFMLLRDFEKTENELEQKLIKKKEEHLEQQSKLAEIQLKIDSKRKDIEKIEESQKHLMTTYHQLTHDETKYADFLSKVYKRKIKRKKNTEGAPEDEESEEESEDDDDDDEDMDNDDDDSEGGEAKEQLDLDICPNGLRQELFDQVCQLREKRLDFEELQAEEKKVLEQLKKDQDGLIKKGKIVENGLKQAQQDLENFQKEKQKKINDLDIVVLMRLNQLQFLDKNHLPADLSSALVFDSKNLDRLQSRIKELQVEKAAEKKLFKNLKEHHQELIRDKKKMDEYVGKLDELCNKMMVDKFGKIVDIEKLELIAVNQQIEELKQRMAENEFEHEKVMQDWLSKINFEKDESTEMLRSNTKRINEMVDILSETKRLETQLDAKQSSLGEELAGTTKKDVEERQRLHTLVQLQAQEVEALKAEIAILSRKGGHILPPTQPPALTQLQAS